MALRLVHRVVGENGLNVLTKLFDPSATMFTSAVDDDVTAAGWAAQAARDVVTAAATVPAMKVRRVRVFSGGDFGSALIVGSLLVVMDAVAATPGDLVSVGEIATTVSRIVFRARESLLQTCK
jgi:hypothetical protein